MDINITQFFNTQNPGDYFAPAYVNPNTWANARRAPVLLDTPEKLQALRDTANTFGAWDDDEIVAWTDTECNALFVQLVSAEMSEGDLAPGCDWDEHHNRDDGHASNIYMNDCQIFYTLEG